MVAPLYAEVVVNVEAPVEGTFHYHVPNDLATVLRVGHFVEVQFGPRLAQGIVVGLGESSPVEQTKPIITLVDPEPVVEPYQIELARWLSDHYLTPLNACMRLMLPPGLSRWSDVTYEVNPYWDGSGLRTDAQKALVALLQERGDLRGNQIRRAMKGMNWKSAGEQLAKRDILRKASYLDPPRIRPKSVRMVELSAGWERIAAALPELGSSSVAARVLHTLLISTDPLPEEAAILDAANADPGALDELEAAGLINRLAGRTLIVAATGGAPPEWSALMDRLPASPEELGEESAVEELDRLGLVRRVVEPAALNLAVNRRQAVREALARQRGERYWAVLSLLAERGVAQPVGEVYKETGAALKHLRKLADLDLVTLLSTEVWRDSLADREFAPSEPPSLTADQARVWGRIKVAMLAADGGDLDDEDEWDDDKVETDDDLLNRPFLLHGVTGSGKTEIYIRAIEQALAQGQQGIVLVPEIALTPQTVRRFAARFPGRVAILHSGLSDGERYDTWRRSREGLFDIVVGPRSAMFLPFKNLGVIVVDEEHDQSYKQTPPVPPPYYHARDAAVRLAELTGATVIMGSATPDVVTYYRAQSGRYHLLELPKRIMGHSKRITSLAQRFEIDSRYQPLVDSAIAAGDEAMTIPLPPIQIVDLRQELRAGNRSIFSRPLQEAIAETLQRGEQCILFLNRRGSASFVICRDCGHVMTCPRCDLPLTYHRHNPALVCHQCGRREPQPPTCPTCGSDRIRYFGLGTERVEALVGSEWPEARIVRWDSDTTTGHQSHEALLSDFIDRKADILIGTQMIAKGLDLPFVTLVGVISADVALGLPDYRAEERTFQLLAQVAGRAGRGLLGGRVIVQTYQPENYAIQAAAEHDYAGFFVDEIRFRSQQRLPPYRRMATLVVVDPVNDRARREAEDVYRRLRIHARELGRGAVDLLGPVPPFFNRIDGRYRWQIVVRSEDPTALLADFPLGPTWIVDIDPVSTL